MKIKYIVAKLSIDAGRLNSSQEKEFDNVEDAIKYHRQQKEGAFSWWDITVDYI